MSRQGIPVAPAMELRFWPVLFGPNSPGVRCEWWSTASGEPRYTGKHVIVPAALVAKLVDALRDAAKEACTGPLFAPSPEQRL